MKYFVIGAGSIGRRHYANLHKLGADVILISWRGSNLNKIFLQLSPHKGNLAVIVATSTNIRMSLIDKCAKIGAALYIEKPIAFRSEDIKKIYSLPSNVLKRSVAGFMLRYHPLVNDLLKYVPKNMYRASFEIGHNVNKWRKNWKFSKSYSSNSQGGGVLLDLCHEIDLAFLLCGRANLKSVYSIGHNDYENVDISTMLNFSNNSSLVFSVSMDYLAPSLIRKGSLLGTDSYLDYDISKQYLKIKKITREKKIKYHFSRNKMYLDLMSDFMRLANGHKVLNQNIPSLDKIKMVCKVIAQAWEKRKFTSKLDIKLK